jgi:hypothetical protein
LPLSGLLSHVSAVRSIGISQESDRLLLNSKRRYSELFSLMGLRLMDVGRSSEKLMGMSDAVWQRHANPISGWSRVPVLPLLALGIWSRVWLGWWALLPIVAVLIWTWLNPRIFPVPNSIDNWMSKGVLGERVLLNRSKEPIPFHHARMATILNVLAGVGLIPFVVGLVQLNVWATVAGTSVMMIAKLWFLDRMVWLFDEMKDSNDEYRSWLR